LLAVAAQLRLRALEGRKANADLSAPLWNASLRMTGLWFDEGV